MSDKKMLLVIEMVIAVVCGFCLVLLANLGIQLKDRGQEVTDDLTYFTDFSLENVDGSTFTQDDLKGYKLTVINGWATWCGPCTNELPVLQNLSEEYKDKGVQVIGIVADYGTANETMDDIENVVSSTGVTYPILLADEAFYKEPYLTMNSAFPCTWAVDEDGNVIEIISGAMSEDNWRKAFDQWLEGYSMS